MLKIEFETDNAAFADDDLLLECAAIVRAIANRMADGRTHGRAIDSNGNKVGQWSVTP